MKVFPGKILIKLDPHWETKNGIKIISKLYRKKHKGKVVQDSDNFKKGDHVFFLSTEGQQLDGDVLMHERDIILIIKANKVKKILGTRVLLEPEKEKSELAAGLKASEAHRKIIPIATVLQVGDEVTKIKEGDKVIYDQGRETNLTPYEVPGYDKKIIYMVREADILSII